MVNRRALVALFACAFAAVAATDPAVCSAPVPSPPVVYEAVVHTTPACKQPWMFLKPPSNIPAHTAVAKMATWTSLDLCPEIVKFDFSNEGACREYFGELEKILSVPVVVVVVFDVLWLLYIIIHACFKKHTCRLPACFHKTMAKVRRDRLTVLPWSVCLPGEAHTHKL
jgi:hypothetical protein